MAVLKSNKQSKPYNKGRKQEGAGTFSSLFLNTTRDREAMERQVNLVPRKVSGALRPDDIKAFVIATLVRDYTSSLPALLLICHTQIYKGMQTLFFPFKVCP